LVFLAPAELYEAFGVLRTSMVSLAYESNLVQIAPQTILWPKLFRRQPLPGLLFFQAVGDNLKRSVYFFVFVAVKASFKAFVIISLRPHLYGKVIFLGIIPQWPTDIVFQKWGNICPALGRGHLIICLKSSDHYEHWLGRSENFPSEYVLLWEPPEIILMKRSAIASEFLLKMNKIIWDCLDKWPGVKPVVSYLAN
jgi:hypothetical protein